MKRIQSSQFDVVIVGSGPAGVHAAYPLVESGLKVAIIDAGLDNKKNGGQMREFPDVHITKNGHYYDFIKKSSYVFNKTYDLLKVKSNIEIFQSLAKGGLSEVWHGICDFYTDEELEAIGLPVNNIKREYKEVSKRINLKIKPNLDYHNTLILEASKRKNCTDADVYQVPIAFHYTTRLVIDDLKKKFKNFTYIPNQLVIETHEKRTHVEIQSISISKSEAVKTNAKFLILAAGSINTTKILLKSFNFYNYKTSFLTKANYVIACLHAQTLFKKSDRNNSDVGQVVLFVKSKTAKKGTGTFTQLYKLNPLILDKVLKFVPLPKSIAAPLLSIVAPSIVVADARFPSFESKQNFCILKKDSNGEDVLVLSYHESENELLEQKMDCKKIEQNLRFLGLFPLKKVYDHISSHYAGGVPFLKKPGELSVDAKGKLHQAKRIYVADASTWRALPAKAPTLTIMANASRIGKNVLKNFN
jgi:hypothetical protein